MDAKKRILRAGARIVLEKGFFDTGLSEVLEAAKVPKGSFYFYFKNKEEFGLQLIDFFAGHLKAANDKIYKVEGVPHVERIRRAYKSRVELFQKKDFKGGCPIGNLALEMGDRNPDFRGKLSEVFADMKQNLADQLRLARSSGEISEAVDVDDTADFMLSSFEGALMQMKVSKSLLPYEVFERMIFERLLDDPAV